MHIFEETLASVYVFVEIQIYIKINIQLIVCDQSTIILVAENFHGSKNYMKLLKIISI